MFITTSPVAQRPDSLPLGPTAGSPPVHNITQLLIDELYERLKNIKAFFLGTFYLCVKTTPGAITFGNGRYYYSPPCNQITPLDIASKFNDFPVVALQLDMLDERFVQQIIFEILGCSQLFIELTDNMKSKLQNAGIKINESVKTIRDIFKSDIQHSKEFRLFKTYLNLEKEVRNSLDKEFNILIEFYHYIEVQIGKGYVYELIISRILDEGIHSVCLTGSSSEQKFNTTLYSFMYINWLMSKGYAPHLLVNPALAERLASPMPPCRGRTVSLLFSPTGFGSKSHLSVPVSATEVRYFKYLEAISETPTGLVLLNAAPGEQTVMDPVGSGQPIPPEGFANKPRSGSILSSGMDDGSVEQLHGIIRQLSQSSEPTETVLELLCLETGQILCK